MSYTQIVAFDENGDTVHCEEFRNSHYWVVIWHTIWAKYQLTREDNTLDEHSYMRSNKLWDHQHNPKLSDDDWYVFVCSFDTIIIPPELVNRVCEAFLNFKPTEKNVVDHSAGFVREMRAIQEVMPGFRGISWYKTSIAEDPWDSVIVGPDKCPKCERNFNVEIPVDKENRYYCEKCEEDFGEYKPYNLDEQDDWYYLKPREEFIKDGGF